MIPAVTVTSVFIVTEYKTTKKQKVEVEGYGQETINALRREYPRFTKFVLEGFNIGGKFKKVRIW